MRPAAWLGWLSRRWFVSRRENGGAASSTLAVAGIAVGVTALVVVIGVMNGFQMGYMDSILEISSYHARIQRAGRGGPSAELLARLRSEAGVRCVVPFLETQVLIGSRGGRSSPVKLRALPADSLREDGGFANALGLGAAALSGGEAVVIGAELARYLDVAPGDEITLLAILSGGEEGVETRSLVRKVSAVFRSGFYDYDFGLGFMNVEGASAIFPPDTERPWVYGVKLQDRDGDAAFLGRLSREGIPGAEGWREYNRSFFGALRTEKTMMLLLVGLIFLVVGVNIYQAMRRNVFERMEDMALVKALGGRGEELRRIFILDGFAIGFFGAAIGLVLGLLVATNVNEIFAAAAFAMNGLSALIAGLSGSLPSDYSVFSPAYFYISEVPVRLLFPELFFIVLAALASSTAAAAVASSRIASLNPAELLRYE